MPKSSFICATCSTSFEMYVRANKPPKYCSKACMCISRKPPLPNKIPCECGCGTLINDHSRNNKPKRYVLGHAAKAAIRDGHILIGSGNKNPNWRGGPLAQICQQCGAEFLSMNRQPRKYCTRKCAYASPTRSPQKRIIVNCVVCSKPLSPVTPGHANSYKTCVDCRAAHRTMLNKELGDKLRGTHPWSYKEHPRGMLGKKHSQETLRVLRSLGELRVGSHISKESIEKALATKMARYGTTAPPNYGNQYSRARRGKREDLDNVYFRSSWEANYARYLNWQVACGAIKGWNYESRRFTFEGVTRRPRTYLPDFEVEALDGTITYHEVKGWMDSKSRSKLKRMAKFFPDIVICVIGATEYAVIAADGGAYSPCWEYPKKQESKPRIRVSRVVNSGLEQISERITPDAPL